MYSASLFNMCAVYWTWCCYTIPVYQYQLIRLYIFQLFCAVIDVVVVVVFVLFKWSSFRIHEPTHCIRAKSIVGKVPMSCVMSFRYINYTLGLINSTCKWFVAIMDMEMDIPNILHILSNWTFFRVCETLTVACIMFNHHISRHCTFNSFLMCLFVRNIDLKKKKDKNKNTLARTHILMEI